MQPVTIKTIAEKLGLSIATVSRALKDSYEISAATREKVKQAALEMGYQPNVNASGLRAGSSKTIAVMVPEVENHFFSQVISGIESVAREYDYHVLIYLTHEDPKKEEAFVHLLGNGRADGLLISVTHNRDGYAHLNRMASAGFPMVLFDRLVEEVAVPHVCTNNEAISFEATSLLYQRGAKKTAFLGLDADLFITRTRLAGYKKAVEQFDPGAAPLVFAGTGKPELDLPRLKNFLHKYQPDALFGASESMALLLYELGSQEKFHIPDDYQLISFTNLSAVPFLNPSLTAIIQPAFEIGKEAAELLFKVIKKKKIYSAEQKRELPSAIRLAASIRAPSS
ncbi:LacI family DNA-binding transcriptional regulator [Flavihumibacter sp. UBA7668]|uniref:LacI family DNA-binding transcriptional regulator n=1 Tax=Flavihumibacter sp. UBA7668 TaxID=1946542 RepID=UPI0025C45610|nr:LacI family DNA-binding transcriptional regulator [Flavihumibacter sp. UBA7668]